MFALEVDLEVLRTCATLNNPGLLTAQPLMVSLPPLSPESLNRNGIEI
jgi:hypothetical protein